MLVTMVLAVPCQWVLDSFGLFGQLRNGSCVSGGDSLVIHCSYLSALEMLHD